MAEIFEQHDRVVAVARVDIPPPGVRPTKIRLAATEVFAELAAYCAEKGVLADLTRANWMLDYDLNMMTDRVVVQAPLMGQPLALPASVDMGGTFDGEMRAIGRG